MTNRLKTSWTEVDPSEIRFIPFDRIGGPGQYRDRANNPDKFYLPLADSSGRLALTFSEQKQLVAIQRGPAFKPAQWDQIVREIESTGPIKFGRNCSSSSLRVTGSWRGPRSGVQFLPTPADAPVAPVEMAEHPFILRVSAESKRRLDDHKLPTDERSPAFDPAAEHPARRSHAHTTTTPPPPLSNRARRQDLQPEMGSGVLSCQFRRGCHRNPVAARQRSAQGTCPGHVIHERCPRWLES